MGRTRAQSKKSKILQQDTVNHEKKGSTEPPLSSLLEKAQTLVAQCDYELAFKFIHRILERSPTHVEAMEMLGVVQLETGELEAAKRTFLSLLQLNSSTTTPPPPPSAHLYLAQLSDEDPLKGLEHYQAAIDILKAQLKGKDRAVDHHGSDEAEMKNQIVRAYVGMVEIWMDPSYNLCFEPTAEKVCEDYLNLALKTDPDNPEALQALASVRMSQQRPEEAKQCLEKAWSVWKDMDLDDPRLPPIPTRLALVKLFLELSLFTPALLVIHGVMGADDQEVEAWYLEGWCFFLMSEQAKESGGTMEDLTWEELAKDARDCLETCQMLHRNEGHPDTPLLEHAQELIAKLNALGVSPSELDSEADEGAWEDDDASTDNETDGDVDML